METPREHREPINDRMGDHISKAFGGAIGVFGVFWLLGPLWLPTVGVDVGALSDGIDFVTLIPSVVLWSVGMAIVLTGAFVWKQKWMLMTAGMCLGVGLLILSYVLLVVLTLFFTPIDWR
jgi:hypothetical protein